MSAPTGTQDAELVAAAVAIQQYAQATQAVRARVLGYLGTLFDALGNYHSPDTFVPAAVAAVDGGQRTVAALTTAHLSQLYGTLAGSSPAPATVPIGHLTDQVVRGVPAAEVYRRPFVTLWTDLAGGKPFDAAWAAAGRRLDTLVATDLQLATTHTARTVLEQQQQVVGYRRVLTGDHHCGLCILASTQRYHVADLMPIHPNCQCVVAPILGDRDPGRYVNTAVLTGGNPLIQTPHGVDIYHGDDTIDVGDLLPSVHQAMRDRFGKSSASGTGRFDYRHIILTREHGELGPVLTVKDQHFLTRREINRRNL